jgi:hypothetical protein
MLVREEIIREEAAYSMFENALCVDVNFERIAMPVPRTHYVCLFEMAHCKQAARVSDLLLCKMCSRLEGLCITKSRE